MKSKIYIGDSRWVLPKLLKDYNEKISLVVTSPPYFVNRGYESYIKSKEDYWCLLDDIFNLLYPLIENGGKVAINFADKYANAKDFGRPLESVYIPNYMEVMRKYDLWARIIWNKNCIPQGARHVTSNRFNGHMRVSPSWEYIFVWRKWENKDVIKKDIQMDQDTWRKCVKGVWDINAVRKNPVIGNTKMALFPSELPSRLIQMYTVEGDIVLDPFSGIGTTVGEANKLGRIGVGIEKNEEMLPYIKDYLQPDMFSKEVIYEM